MKRTPSYIVEKHLSAFVKSFNEIQDNLNQIKAKEKILNTHAKGVELSKSAKNQVISDIQFIYSQLHKNKQNLASVTKKLKDSNIEIGDLNTAIANLNKQITDKENEIVELKQHLEKLNVDFSNLQDMYQTQGVQLGEEIEALNTAYYAIGTSAFLKKNGIITKEGGFIGLGKTTELNKNFNGVNFTRIDINAIKEIPLKAAKKVRLITTHPTISSPTNLRKEQLMIN